MKKQNNPEILSKQDLEYRVSMCEKYNICFISLKSLKNRKTVLIQNNNHQVEILEEYSL